MRISFDFPVTVWLDPEDMEESEFSYCNAVIHPIQLEEPPYELTLDARGNSSHLISAARSTGTFYASPTGNSDVNCPTWMTNRTTWNLF